MNTVKVKRQELLTKVRANRDAHRELFLKAQAGYRKLVIEELDRMLTDAREGRPIQRSVTLTEPSDHRKDYDRVITMLEMSVDDTITLDSEDFSHFVMDEWAWQGSRSTPIQRMRTSFRMLRALQARGGKSQSSSMRYQTQEDTAWTSYDTILPPDARSELQQPRRPRILDRPLARPKWEPRHTMLALALLVLGGVIIASISQPRRESVRKPLVPVQPASTPTPAQPVSQPLWGAASSRVSASRQIGALQEVRWQ